MNEQTTRRGIVNHAHGRYPGWQLYEQPLPDRREPSVDWRIRYSNYN